MFFTCRGDKQLVLTVTLKPVVPVVNIRATQVMARNVTYLRALSVTPMPFGRIWHKIKSRNGRKK